MKLHANHRTCPSSRRLICRRRGTLHVTFDLTRIVRAGRTLLNGDVSRRRVQ